MADVHENLSPRGSFAHLTEANCVCEILVSIDEEKMPNVQAGIVQRAEVCTEFTFLWNKKKHILYWALFVPSQLPRRDKVSHLSYLALHTDLKCL